MDPEKLRKLGNKLKEFSSTLEGMFVFTIIIAILIAIFFGVLMPTFETVQGTVVESYSVYNEKVPSRHVLQFKNGHTEVFRIEDENLSYHIKVGERYSFQIWNMTFFNVDRLRTIIKIIPD